MMRSIFALLVLVLLSGCGSADNGGASTEAIGQGLDSGEFELNVDGRITSVGPYSGDRTHLEFRPSTYQATRERNDGFGGRQRVRATNADGPYALMMRADLARGDDEPDRETGVFHIQLPPDARAGETYVMRGASHARHGEAVGELGGYGQTLMNTGTGEVTIAEIGEHLSLSFDFSVNEPDHERYLRVHGRAWRIPLTRQGETHYTFTDEEGTETHVDATVFRNPRSVMVGQRMSFDFAEDHPPAGEYRIGRRSGPGVVHLGIHGRGRMDLDGHLNLSHDDGVWSASFQFEGEGVSGEGTIEHLRSRFN